MIAMGRFPESPPEGSGIMSMPLLVEVAEKAFGAAAEVRTRPSTEFSLATLTRDFDAGVRDFSRRLLDPELATSRATIVLAL